MTDSKVKIQKSKSSKPQTMAELLASHNTSFVRLNKGENLEGVITKLTSSEILVDIGAKTEAVVLEKEKRILRTLLSNLKVGDKVTVNVLNPESDFGYPVVSLRRFIDDKFWDKLTLLQKNKEEVEVAIDELTKGGFLVSSKEGISGFLPNSQISFFESAQNVIGKIIKVCVYELNRPLRKIIFSQKALMGNEEFDKLVKNIKPEQKIDSIIANIAPFGIFTTIQTEAEKFVEGFIHISEIAWDKTAEISDAFKVGNKIESMVTGFDKEAKRVNLSLKRLTYDPFEEKVKEFSVDKKVTGKILEVSSNGLRVSLGEEIEGFIKKEKLPPKMSFDVGTTVTATVSEVDKRRHRIILVPVLLEKPIGYR